MKGIDCTPEQIASASRFLADRGWKPEAGKAVLTRENTVRLIAWYGACRYIAGRDGSGGTLERPGFLDVVTTEEAGMDTQSHEGAVETEAPAGEHKAVDQADGASGETAGESEQEPAAVE